MRAMPYLHRYRSWLLPALTALVVLSVAAALAPLTWHLLGKRTDIAAPANIPLLSQGTGTDLSPILALAPFGSATPRSSATDNAAPATGALVLKGVMMGRPAATSIAFIAAPGENTAIYRAGARLPGGATLDMVHGDRVFLLVGGRREVLTFPEASVQQGRASVRAMIPAKFGGDAGAASASSATEPALTTTRTPPSLRSAIR